MTPQLARKRRSQLRIIVDRFIRNRLAVAGLVVLLLMGLAAIFAPALSGASASNPDPSITIDFKHNHIFESPSFQHLLGTDNLARDEFARILYGGRVSLLVGVLSMFMALVVGVGIGALAGYFGGIIDNILMRITDVILAIPLYLLLFVLSAGSNGAILGQVLPLILPGDLGNKLVSFLQNALGNSNWLILNMAILIAVFGWTYTARLVRGEFLALKEREYILAARTLGAGNLRLMLRHILPNAIGPIIVNATLLVGSNIITESVLSFFGFGIQVPLASWGSMLNSSQEEIFHDPLLVWAPGLCILIVVLSINLMGDGLRDALDPYLTER